MEAEKIRRQWDEALADCKAKRAHSDNMPLGTEGEDEAQDDYCHAADDLITRIPAPDAEAVAEKLELALSRSEGFGFCPTYGEAILADLRRLAREG